MSISSSAGVLLEACVESLAEALAAQDAGAGRVELCFAATEGGLTPGAALTHEVCARLTIPVYAMIRPRGGDFCFSAADVRAMCRDIETAREAGAAGIVTGVLDTRRNIDDMLLRELVAAAKPLPVTFHRAFDVAADLDVAFDVLLDAGVARLLTSGGAPRAIDGAVAIAEYVKRAGDRLVVMAGGSVRADHVAALVSATGVREVHSRPVLTASRDQRGDGIHFESRRPAIDPAALRAIRSELDR